MPIFQGDCLTSASPCAPLQQVTRLADPWQSWFSPELHWPSDISMRSSQYTPHAHPARSRLRDPGSQSPRPSRCCRCCSGSRCSQAGSSTSADALCLLGHVRSCYILPPWLLTWTVLVAPAPAPTAGPHSHLVTITFELSVPVRGRDPPDVGNRVQQWSQI